MSWGTYKKICYRLCHTLQLLEIDRLLLFESRSRHVQCQQKLLLFSPSSLKTKSRALFPTFLQKTVWLVSGERCPKETESSRRGVSLSCLLQPTAGKSRLHNEEFGLAGLLPGSLLQVSIPDVLWKAAVLRQKSLSQIALVWLLQMPTWTLSQQSVLQVVFLYSDPTKSLQRCASSGAGLMTLQQHRFSRASLLVPASLSLVSSVWGGSIPTSGVLQHRYSSVFSVKALRLLSGSCLTLLAAAAPLAD